jgi:hypothetical protein
MMARYESDSEQLLKDQLRVAWSRLRQLEDAALIRDSTVSDDLAKELIGRTIKIVCPDLTAHTGNLTFADTGEPVPGIRRVEITLDAQTNEVTARFYRWKHNDQAASSLEHAETSSIELSTLAAVKEVL